MTPNLQFAKWKLELEVVLGVKCVCIAGFVFDRSGF